MKKSLTFFLLVHAERIECVTIFPNALFSGDQLLFGHQCSNGFLFYLFLGRRIINDFNSQSNGNADCLIFCSNVYMSSLSVAFGVVIIILFLSFSNTYLSE